MPISTLQSGSFPSNVAIDTDTLVVDGANNRVGVGTSSPNQKLHVYDSSTNATHIRTTNSNGDIFYGLDANGAGYAWMNSGSGSFYVGTSGAGDLIAYAGSAERMRLLAGGGLTFNGDTAAANALDDYEEGTFVPAYSAASSTLSATGRYTKIGRIVTIQVDIRAVQSGTTFGQITGFPFAISTQNYLSIAMREFYSTGNALFTNCSVGSTSTGTLYQTPSNSTAVNGTTYGFAFSFTYHTA